MGEAQGGSFLVRDVERLAAADQEALVERLRARGGPVFRLIATTTRDLAEPVRAARFNADLYYRLQIVPVTLTAPASLAERLVHVGRALVASFAREEGKDLSGLTGEAEALVAAHDWPGGWRQLENTLFRAVLLAEGAVITAADLPRLSSIGEPRSAHRTPISAPDAIARPAPLRSPHLLTLMGERGELRSFAELEAEVLRFAMNHYNGHISAISQHLRIGRSTLYRKLKELGLGADGMAA
jgi:DNA-binding NtrC family response regulator